MIARRLAVTCLALAALAAAPACRERGTLTIGLDELDPACWDGVTEVYAYFVPRASCGACMCGGGCPACEQGCVQACGGTACSIDEVERHGIVFEPPAAGQYAAIYKLRRPAIGGGAEEVGVVCAEVVVDSDGTAGATVEPAYARCCL